MAPPAIKRPLYPGRVLFRVAMGLHRYNNGPQDVPSRPSSATSFSSYEASNSANSYNGQRYGQSSGNPFQNRQSAQNQNEGYGSGSGRYSGGYGERPRGPSSFQEGAPASRRNDFDSVDSRLMSANVGQLGLDPSPMAPIKKEFYREHPEVSCMTSTDVEAFRKSAQMNISGKDIPKPILKFTQAGYPEAIEKKLLACGYDQPTPIQSQGWSMALSGKNMVGIAQTGSGKTLSFILPALVHVKEQAPINRGDGPIVLVLAPTRELAVQIQEVARVFGNAVRINSTCVYGGAPKGPQIRNVRNGCEMIVATPGRLLDLINEGIFNLQRCSFVVLDEADRMLDMGFEPQVRQILKLIRTDRQVLMWSATWPKNVQRLAHDMLGRDFIQVKIGASELHANKKIRQNVAVCSDLDKKDHLNRVLQEVWDSLPAPAADGKNSQKQMVRTIIFCNKKRTVDYITTSLKRDYWPVVAIHGDKAQYERDQAIRMLKSGEATILVATDVAARGLDVKDVMLVINFDMPNDIENYVHRIGRTARGAAEEGTSYAFVTAEDKAVIGDLAKIMRDAGQEVPPELEAMAPFRRSGPSKSFGGGYGNNRRYGGGYGGGYGRGHHGGNGNSHQHTRF